MCRCSKLRCLFLSVLILSAGLPCFGQFAQRGGINGTSTTRPVLLFPERKLRCAILPKIIAVRSRPTLRAISNSTISRPGSIN